MGRPSDRVAAVVVDYHAGEALVACVDSLAHNGAHTVVLVENGESGSIPATLRQRDVVIVEPGLNLGYGRGVNRGVAFAPASEFLLVSNPDVVVHEGALDALVAYLDTHRTVGVVGPKIVRPDGTVYPSQRVFPNVWTAALHALLAPLWANNPATRAYRSPRADGTVDWVSGACFLIRRDVFEQVGGFDERYFMFAEDMALCWRVGRAGYGVGVTNEAVVTHIEGLSRQRASRAMLIAHHTSAMRFEFQTARGLRRVVAPLAVAVLSLRLALALVLPSRT